MPPGNADDGLRAAEQIRAAHPDIGVLILSQYLEAHYALKLVGDRAQGVGYLLKQRISDVSLLADAVRRVARGGSALDPEVVQRMVARPRTGSPINALTPRERDVLALMAEGRSNGAIAARLVVTVGRSKPRDRDFRQARTASRAGRPPSSAGGAQIPQVLNSGGSPMVGG